MKSDFVEKREKEKAVAKKNKVKKTLVEQILTKAKIEHIGLQINALEGILPEGIDRSTIFKTLALKGDKRVQWIGIIPITEHLSEKKLAKLSGNKKVAMIPQKDLEKQQVIFMGPIIRWAFVKSILSQSLSMNQPFS